MKKAPMTMIAYFILALSFINPTFGRAASFQEFEKACESKLKKNNVGVCHCIAVNLEQKKTTAAQLALLTENYKAKGAARSDEDADVLIDFEAQVAEECLKNPHYKIKIDPKKTQMPQSLQKGAGS